MIQLKLWAPNTARGATSPTERLCTSAFPHRPTLSEEPELEIRQAGQLNPLTVRCHPLNHTPFPPFLRVWAPQVFTCDIYLAGALRAGCGNTVKGVKHSERPQPTFFRHLRADMLQGQRVSEARTTSFQFSERNIAITLLLLRCRLPAQG